MTTPTRLPGYYRQRRCAQYWVTKWNERGDGFHYFIVEGANTTYHNYTQRKLKYTVWRLTEPVHRSQK